MKKKLTHIAILTVLVSTLTVHFAMGSFTGSSDKEDKNKFSLKNLNKISKTGFSLSFMKNNNFQFKGTLNLTLSGYAASNGSTTNSANVTPEAPEMSSMIRMENGNTTFVYPYKYKVKVPKFRTPTAPNIR